MKRFLAVILLIGSSLAAGEDRAPRREQAAAATAEAIQTLRNDVGATLLGDNLTVEQFIQARGADEQFESLLKSAEQIGGTRWIDDQTCIVRLRLRGDEVAESLLQISQDKPGQPAVPSESFKKQVDALRQRVFSAEGTSTPPEAFDVRPAGPWRDVLPEDRRKAIDAARDNAVGNVINSIARVELNQEQTVGDVLKNELAAAPLRNWLSARPVVDASFGSDLNVRITLSVPDEELWKLLRAAIEKQKSDALPADEEGWRQLRAKVLRETARPVGEAALNRDGTHKVTQLELPDLPPAWVSEQLDAAGAAQSESPGDALRTQNRAFCNAAKSLREQVDALPIDSKTTLGQAAERDPSIDEAIKRALQHARAYKVVYEPDGSASLRISIDLRDVWQELITRD